jgi:hypothetical protein
MNDNSGRNGIAAGFVAHLEPLLVPVTRELQRGRPALCLELAIDLVNNLNDGVDDDQGSNYGEPRKFAEEIDALCVKVIAALAVQQPAPSAAQIVRVRTRVRSAFNNSAWKRHRDYGWPDENVFKSLAALQQLAPQEGSTDTDDQSKKRRRSEPAADAADAAGASSNPIEV